VAPDCPVCQRSNGYFTPTVVCKGTVEVNSVRLRAQKSEQKQKAHWTVNRTCPVNHRTVRWPHLSELQRSNPNGWVTWLAHRLVSGGAPDCPVAPLVRAPTVEPYRLGDVAGAPVSVRWRTGLSGAPYDSSLPQRPL
jgi:hypothetical protein